MDKIAPELLLMISSYLEHPLAQYSHISRKWQHVIEPRTFAFIRTDSTNEGRRQFNAAFSTTRRRNLLRELTFKVQLPVPSEKRFRKLQSSREAAVNRAAYTHEVLHLFSTLAAWDDRDANISRFALEINVSKSPPWGWEPPEGYEPQHWQLGEPIWTIRNNFKYIGFDTDILQSSSGPLPVLPTVSEFKHGSYPNVDPAVLAVYAEALPNVAVMDWEFTSPPRRLPALQDSIRSSLSDALTTAAGSSLRDLTSLDIFWMHDDPWNQTIELPSYIKPGSVQDPLSVAIRHISQLPSLRHLNLTGCHVLSDQVFGGTTDDPGVWPSLETFVLDISHTTPDGNWYFTGDPASAEVTEGRVDDDSDESFAEFDSDDSDTSDFAPEIAWEREDGMRPMISFRRTPHPETFTAFCLAMVRAVRHMPALRQLQLSTSHNTRPTQVEIGYFGPGSSYKHVVDVEELLFHESHDPEARWVVRLIEVSPGWEIPALLMYAMSETGNGEDSVYVSRIGEA